MYCLTALIFPSESLALSDAKESRDLMDEGKFVEPREALWLAAHFGNAEAKELIGVMCAICIGVERDPVWAFEKYLRSAMKRHPGA